MRRTLIAVMGLLSASAALAQPRFVASEIPLGEWPDDLFFADMDGDGRSDLVLPRWSLNAGRELAIYLQDSESRFPTSPSRLVEIKPEIIAIAIADLRPEPGNELLLFTARSVFSLSSAIPSYTGNLRPLFDWPLVGTLIIEPIISAMFLFIAGFSLVLSLRSSRESASASGCRSRSSI